MEGMEGLAIGLRLYAIPEVKAFLDFVCDNPGMTVKEIRYVAGSSVSSKILKQLVAIDFISKKDGKIYPSDNAISMVKAVRELREQLFV
jgi:hypothetical protein